MFFGLFSLPRPVTSTAFSDFSDDGGQMTRISRQVDMIKENTDDIYTGKILRPATDTFLTAEWDEMVPFPNSKSIVISITILLLLLLLLVLVLAPHLGVVNLPFHSLLAYHV
jgi:hypothetical protein